MRTLLTFLVALPALAAAQAPSHHAVPAPPYPGAPPPAAESAPAPAAEPSPEAAPEPAEPAPAAEPSPEPAPAPEPAAPPAPAPAPAPALPPPAGRAPPAPAPAPHAGTRPPAAPPLSRRPGGAAATPSPQAQAGKAGGTARATEKCTPLRGRFLLAFNNADIVDVLEQASRWTCRNFAFTDSVARGKITLLSKTPVSAEEAYAAFLAALNANNIAVYPSGRYYKLVRIADAKKTPIPTLLESGAEAPALEQPVTKLFKLRYADPDQLRAVMGNFTSPQGADIQSVPPDTLIVTDIGLNVRRIERMIEAIDQPGGSELIRFIQVRYASAKDLAEKVNQVFQPSPGQTGKGARRPVIGGVTRGRGAPAAAPAATGGEEIGFSKVLADERTNKLVVVADDKSFDRIRELVEQLDVPAAGEGQIHVVFMKNAVAEDLAQTLQALAQGQASARRQGAAGAPAPTPLPAAPQPPAAAGAAGGTTASLFSGEVKITADKVSNALLVLASGSDFASIERLVEKLDIPRRQVFVEAVILEVNLNDETVVGAAAPPALPRETSVGAGAIPLSSQPGAPSFTSFNPLAAVSLGGFLTGLVGPVSAELKDVLPGIPSIGVLIQALQTNSDVNVISTPHVLATDNEDAEITVGQNVPFQAGFNTGVTNLAGLAGTTGTTSTTSAGNVSGLLSGLSTFAPIQRQNVELRLKIKPQITEGDNVRLVIDEQTEDIASRDPTLGPTTNRRTIKTNITVKDQSTIVIGGLIQERTIQSVKKVPLLGDIPVLGWLFRSNDVTKQKTNLLLFLTPYIIHDQSDYRRIFERKKKEQEEFVEQFYGKKPGYEVAIDYARKAGPYTKVHHDVETETLKLENGGPGAPGERSVTPPGGERPAVKPSGENPPAAPTPPAVPAPPAEAAPPAGAPEAP
jgi:general secretion pathway protein D